jgi:hypothetical protein
MAMELVDFFTSMLLLLVVKYIYIYTTHIWSTYDMDFVFDILVSFKTIHCLSQPTTHI